MKLIDLFNQTLTEKKQLLNEKQILYNNGANYGQVVFLAGGAGCLAKDTGIIMSDGSVKKVQHITPGDKVSGPDGSPRTVEKLHRGKEEMLRVTTVKGDTYTCNRSHIHSFVCSFDKCGFKQGNIYNMTYDEWKSIPKSARQALKLYKSEEVTFTDVDDKDLPVNPCILEYSFTELPEDDYYGFQIKEDDKRFLLESYIVTHNSGKGFALNNFMERKKFRVIDVDEYKKAYLKWSKISRDNVDITRDLGLNDPLDIEKIERAFERGNFKVLNAYPELSNLDLKNPEDVSALHMFVKRKRIKPKVIQNLLKSATPGRLPNIVFDITAKDMDDITDMIPRLLDVGYEPENIHVTWVLTDYEISFERNRNRSRVVPDDILLKTHEGAARTMIEIIKNGTPAGIRGGVRVILNNPEHTITYDREATGSGEEVIKDFKYLTIKPEGEPYKKEQDIQREIFHWIKNNIPRTVKLWKQM